MIMTSYHPSFDASLYLKVLYGWTSIKTPNNATVGYFDPVIIYFPIYHIPPKFNWKVGRHGGVISKKKEITEYSI